MAVDARLRLPVASPFDLDLTLRGPGWVELAPHGFARELGRLRTTIDLAATPGGSGPVVDVDLRQSSPAALSATLRSRAPLRPEARGRLRTALRRCLALDVELGEFWQRCAAHPRLAWVAQRGAGRLMRSPTLFEDLFKLLLTTNCTWANTCGMVTRTVATLGRRGPAGTPAFPSARRCTAEPESFWRESIRVGYRAAACRALAQRFAARDASAAFEDPELETAELRRRLLALPGFGSYAAGQALRLLGRFDDLALDSWVRQRIAVIHGAALDDAAIARRYAEFEGFAGLALWMDVTREWHEGEG